MNIDWSSIKSVVAEASPLLGTLIGGPAGATVGSMIASALGVDNHPDAVAQALKTDPQAAIKLRQMELDNKVELQKLAVQAESNRLAADTAQIQAVNKTLQTEAMGGDWLQRNHHAIESISAVYMLILIYVVLPLAGKPVPTVPEFAFAMIGAILGVTAWKRGSANIATVTGQTPANPLSQIAGVIGSVAGGKSGKGQ